jgi:ATP-binding cassette, subfamily B, bacterial PglK
MRQYLKEIFVLMGQDKKKLPWLLTLFFLVSFLDILGIGLIAPYVSLVVEPELANDIFVKFVPWIDLHDNVFSLLMIMSAVLLGIFIVKTVSSVWINYLIIKFSTTLRIRLSVDLMNNYQNLPYIEYLRRNSSEYIHTTQNLVSEYSNRTIQTGLGMVSNGIVALAILAMLAYTNMLAFLLLVCLMLVFLIAYDQVFHNKIKVIGKKTNLASIQMVKGIHEGLEGLKEIRVLGHEDYFLNQVRTGATGVAKYSMYSTVVGIIPRYLIELILILFVVLLVTSSLVMGANLQALLPTLAIFGLASVRLLPIANIISNGLIKFRFNRDGVSRLYSDVMRIRDSELVHKNVYEDLPKEQSMSKSFETLTIEDVSFLYPNTTKEVLKHINLKIKRGDSIGIIGESGSGKTTLVDTILGLLDPASGEIYFNGKSLKQQIHNWHEHVAYLPQEIFLIDDKLKSNVALGINEKNIDLELLNQSLEKASLADLLKELPDGIDTILGERGVRLSGGQRQRIALARAFYHKRDILIMDESTSALDNETEKEIVDEIKKLKGSITTVVIAHRFSTIENCDVIYRLNKGEIVDSGPPDDMLGLNDK